MSNIIRRNKKQFRIPREGEHEAVLACVQDLGEVPGEYGVKEKVRFVWVTDERDPETGEPLLCLQSLNRTLNEQSNLFKTIAGTGIEVGDELDLDELVGTQARLVIQHGSSRDGERTYANVLTVLKPSVNQNVEIPFDWVPPKVKTQNGVASPKLRTGASSIAQVPRAEFPAEKNSGSGSKYVPTEEDIPF